jgi:hypothetical protein
MFVFYVNCSYKTSARELFKDTVITQRPHSPMKLSAMLAASSLLAATSPAAATASAVIVVDPSAVTHTITWTHGCHTDLVSRLLPGPSWLAGSLPARAPVRCHRCSACCHPRCPLPAKTLLNKNIIK